MAPLWSEWQPWRGQPVLRLVLAAVGGVLAWSAWNLVEEGAPWHGWLGAFGIPAVVFAFFLSTGLRTEVHADHLLVRMVGLRRRHIPFTDVASFEAVRIRPVREFGGWGIRYGGKQRGWLYNVSGPHAVRIQYRDGRILHVGTQDPDRFVEALQAVGAPQA